MFKTVVDSNIFIYAMLENHPAHDDCVRYLEARDEPNRLFSLVDCILEIHAILTRVYAVDATASLERIEALTRSRVSFIELDAKHAVPSLALSVSTGLHLTDARLYMLACTIEAPEIATEDKRLQAFARSKGLLPTTPVTDETRATMARWERDRLPPAGLPRVLARVHAYLLGKAPASLAQAFKDDTNGFEQLPRA